MIEIRNDEKYSFASYHSAIRKFIVELKSGTSEQSLFEVMQYVSEETLKYQDRLKQYKKKISFADIEIGIGLLSCLISFYVNDEWAKIISATFGSKSILEGAFHLIKNETPENLNSDFAYTWKLARE